MSDVRRRFPEPKKTEEIIYVEETAQKSGCVTKTLLLFLCIITVASGIAAIGYYRAPFVAVPVHYPSMEIEFYGSLRANRRMTKGIKVTGFPGPEVLILDAMNNIYTGLEDGRIIKIEPSDEGVIGSGNLTNVTTGIMHDTPTTLPTAMNGRPHGLRLWQDNILYVADGVYGIYSVNLDTHGTTQIVSINDVNPPMRFPKDVCISKDGNLIYFSDASSRNTLQNFVYSSLDGHADSRVMQFNKKTRKIQVVASKLSFVNGVQLSVDEKILYVCETFRFRVRLIDTSTWKTLKIVPLPMMPNKVRPTGKGTYWVAGSTAWKSRYGILEKYPFLRQIAAGLFRPSVLERVLTNSYSILVEMRKDGKIIQSLHDPEGELISGFTSATTLRNGNVALGSNTVDYFSILDEKHIIIGGAY